MARYETSDGVIHTNSERDRKRITITALIRKSGILIPLFYHILLKNNAKNCLPKTISKAKIRKIKKILPARIIFQYTGYFPKAPRIYHNPIFEPFLLLHLRQLGTRFRTSFTLVIPFSFNICLAKPPFFAFATGIRWSTSMFFFVIFRLQYRQRIGPL